MEMLKNISFEELLNSVTNIRKAYEEKGEKLTFEEALNKLPSFLPNIPFRYFIQLKRILSEHDSFAYEEFKKKHEELEFDITGTTHKEFPYWEIMLDSADSTIAAIEEKLKGNAKIYPGYTTLKNAQNLVLSSGTTNGYALQKAMFFKKYGKKFPNYSVRLEKIETGLGNLVPEYKKFMAKLYSYGITTKSLDTFNLILNRLEYLVEDKAVEHPSNQKYLSKIKFILNN